MCYMVYGFSSRNCLTCCPLLLLWLAQALSQAKGQAAEVGTAAAAATEAAAAAMGAAQVTRGVYCY